jgi:hypothetical protein
MDREPIEQVHPRDRVVRCVQYLPAFLPLYDDAARQTGDYVFGTPLLKPFVQLWDDE